MKLHYGVVVWTCCLSFDRMQVDSRSVFATSILWIAEASQCKQRDVILLGHCSWRPAIGTKESLVTWKKSKSAAESRSSSFSDQSKAHEYPRPQLVSTSHVSSLFFTQIWSSLRLIRQHFACYHSPCEAHLINRCLPWFLARRFWHCAGFGVGSQVLAFSKNSQVLANLSALSRNIFGTH